MYEIATMTTEDDYRRWNAVRNAADPHNGMDDATFLRRIQLPGGSRVQMAAVDSDGTIVAVGQSG